MYAKQNSLNTNCKYRRQCCWGCHLVSRGQVSDIHQPPKSVKIVTNCKANKA